MEKKRLQQSPNDGPLISVVTAALNGAQYLEHTIQSVISQTYGNLEYIIIDGGSTDGTVDIIRNYEPRLAYWHSKPDRGLAHGFNLGLARAHGQWILFLNADDFFLGPEVVETMAPHLMVREGGDVVFGQTILQTCQQDSRPLPLAKTYGRPWRWQEFRRANTIPHPSAFTSRRYFDRVGEFAETYRTCMDYELYLRGREHLKAYFVPMPVSGMREGGRSRVSAINTFREARRSQFETKALSGRAAGLNFIWLVGRHYSGRLAHKLLDPLAARISWISWLGRNPGDPSAPDH